MINYLLALQRRQFITALREAILGMSGVFRGSEIKGWTFSHALANPQLATAM